MIAKLKSGTFNFCALIFHQLENIIFLPQDPFSHSILQMVWNTIQNIFNSSTVVNVMRNENDFLFL